MVDFMDMFPTETACLEYLSAIRFPDGYRCLRCSSENHWKKARGLFLCRDCGYEGSVTRGTLFADTHKPLRLWMQAIWYVVNQKKWRECIGSTKSVGFRQLSHGLGVVTQASPSYGSP